jgi:hypothetical protein
MVSLLQAIKRLRGGVDDMVAVVEGAGFDIFLKSNSHRWELVCTEFDGLDNAIAAAAEQLIDASFRSARP